MAAPIGLQAKVSSCLSAHPSTVAGSKGRGVISKLDSNVVEIVRVNRSVLLQTCAATEFGGGRGCLQNVNLRMGFGVQRGLRDGWPEGQSKGRADARGSGGITRAAVAPQADFEARPEPKVTYVPMELIASEAEFDRILTEAQNRKEVIVVDWMASWCRKCLYLKPKLEKLAAVFHPHVKFYYVDVNSVPQVMVKRAEVTQMPTIQVWRNCEQEGQVIGGHEANTVVVQVQDMIAKVMTRG